MMPYQMPLAMHVQGLLHLPTTPLFAKTSSTRVADVCHAVGQDWRTTRPHAAPPLACSPVTPMHPTLLANGPLRNALHVHVGGMWR